MSVTRLVKVKRKDKIEKKKNNKMVYISLAIITVVVLLICFVTNDKNVKENFGDVDENNALSVGIRKYLEFLWIVDGAFNDSRMGNKIKVNNQEFDENNSVFKCKYDKTNEWCKGENFEEAFRNVFSSDITYNDVYGDGLAVYWYEKREDGYFFQNSVGCSTERMSLNQMLELTKKDSNKLTFKVSYDDNVKASIFQDEHQINRDFILIKENNDWKVSKAYYHDLCFQDYYIPRNYY